MPETTIKEEKTPGCYFKARYVLALMSALGTLNIYSLRNGINVAIVSMTASGSNGNLTFENCTNFNLTCHKEIERNVSDQNGDFDWTIQRQTLLLGCYYYGYCLTNIPGGWLAKRFGIRFILGLTGLVSSLLTLMMPVAAKTSFGLVVGLRIFIGFIQGVTFPSNMSGWGIWAPPKERSRLISATLSGVSTGVFVVYPLVGIIVDSLEWEASFYITGMIGLVYSVIYLSIIHDSPAVHPRISPEERDYIEMSIYGQKVPKDRSPVPWLSIATSLPFWATFAAHFADNWATISVTTLIPTYIASVHGFDIKSTAVLSALPFILRFVMMVLGSFLTDFIIRRRWIRTIIMRKTFFCSWMTKYGVICSLAPHERRRTGAVRKSRQSPFVCCRAEESHASAEIMSSASLIIAGGALMFMAFVDKQKWTAIGLLCISTGILGLSTSGHLPTFVDLAPRYSGILYSISNTAASIIGFVAPQVAGALITDKNLASSWKSVFLLSAAICLVGATLYCAFASDQVQPWARYDKIHAAAKNEELIDEEVKFKKVKEESPEESIVF